MSKHYTKKFNNKSNTISKEDVRGNWEAAFFQRGKIKIDEQCIKTNCPTGSFNPYNIPVYKKWVDFYKKIDKIDIGGYKDLNPGNFGYDKAGNLKLLDI